MAGFLVGSVAALPNPSDADVNRDGSVTTADAVLIMQFAKGLRTGFDFSAPQALAVVPPNGAAGVLLGAGVSVFFSEPMSSATLAGALTLTDTVSGQRVAGRIERSQDGVIATFFPNQPLAADRLYRIDVTTAARDLEGNALLAALTSQYRTHVLGTLALVSANHPSGAIDAVLGQPVAVKALSSTGSPVKQVPIIFTAKQGPGLFEPSRLRQVTVLTEDDGIARVSLRLGGQAVVHTVEATAVGFAPAPVFTARALPLPAVNLRVYSGDSQSGAPGTSPPFPLVVEATDSGGNTVAGVTVTFSVRTGQGNFGGSPTGTGVTNSSGAAQVEFTFGASSGPISVQATFPGMVGQAPAFSLLDLLPQPSSPTAIVGRVIDAKTLQPLNHIYVYLADAPSIWDWTDENGAFRLETAPGPHVVEVDGFESGMIGGNLYPVVAIPVNAVAGHVNELAMPALLPPLELDSFIDVSDTVGGTLTMRSNPLWTMYVAPGQARFANGGRTGRLYTAFVPPDRIPMPPAGGKISRFFDTVQPLNVQFVPPAQVSFPNVDNLTPGTVTDIFTLSYTSGTFLKTGRGQVAEDGRVIESLPGEGITAGGWHQSPDPVVRALCCISGVLKIGKDDLPPNVSVAGVAAVAREIGRTETEILAAFSVCNVPANLGPLNVVVDVPSQSNSGTPVGRPAGRPTPFQGTPDDQGCPEAPSAGTVSLSVDSTKLPMRFGEVAEDLLDIQAGAGSVKVRLEFDQLVTGVSLNCRPRQPSGRICEVCVGADGRKKISIAGLALGPVEVTAFARQNASFPVRLTVNPDVRFVDSAENMNAFIKSGFDQTTHRSAIGVAVGRTNVFFARDLPPRRVTYTPLDGVSQEPDPVVSGKTKFTIAPSLSPGKHSIQASFEGAAVETIEIESFPPAQNNTPIERPVRVAFHAVDGNAPSCGACSDRVTAEAHGILSAQANITVSMPLENAVDAGGLGSGTVDLETKRSILQAASDQGKLAGDVNVFYVKTLPPDAKTGETVCGTQVPILLGMTPFNTIWLPVDPAHCGGAASENLGHTLAHEVGHALSYNAPEWGGNLVVDEKTRTHAIDPWRLMFKGKNGNIVPPKDAARLRAGVGQVFTP